MPKFWHIQSLLILKMPECNVKYCDNWLADTQKEDQFVEFRQIKHLLYLNQEQKLFEALKEDVF